MDFRQPTVVACGLDGRRRFRSLACTDTRCAGAMNSSASAVPGASMWPAFS
jgi:hypothetical protein